MGIVPFHSWALLFSLSGRYTSVLIFLLLLKIIFFIIFFCGQSVFLLPMGIQNIGLLLVLVTNGLLIALLSWGSSNKFFFGVSSSSIMGFVLLLSIFDGEANCFFWGFYYFTLFFLCCPILFDALLSKDLFYIFFSFCLGIGTSIIFFVKILSIGVDDLHPGLFVGPIILFGPIIPSAFVISHIGLAVGGYLRWYNSVYLEAPQFYWWGSDLSFLHVYKIFYVVISLALLDIFL